MSNKAVPQVYRAVIDDVITNVKAEFDEFGVSEDILAELQSKWEAKVIQSHVADFEPVQPPAPPPPQHPSYPPHPIHAAMHNGHYPPPHAYTAAPPPPQHQIAPPPGPTIKSEPVEPRYALNQSPPYTLPPLQGPLGRPTMLSYPPGPGQSRPASTGPTPPAPVARAAVPPAQTRIPQVDGPSSTSSESSTPPPSQSYAPRALHPSLPQPATRSGARSDDDDEAINSDLDDSEDEDEVNGTGGDSADTDIVFCTYDKVARVKNKWKCVLKDGVIHVNGKDYLFAKCACEFEW